MQHTIPHVFREIALHMSTAPALGQIRLGSVHTQSWRVYWDQCCAFAKALHAYPLPHGSRIGILGSNRSEWLVANLGSILAGHVPFGIYPTSSVEQIAYLLQHSEAKVLVVESDALRSQVGGLPSGLHVVQMEPVQEPAGPACVPWAEFLQTGLSIPDSQLQAGMEAQKPGDLATLVYTSGTTANPKAVMLSHHNLLWTTHTAMEMSFRLEAQDVVLSYLPLSHIAEQINSLYGPILSGAQVVFAESLSQLPQALGLVRPTFFIGVPRVWEKIQSKITFQVQQAPRWKRKLFALAQKIGQQEAVLHQAGRPTSLLFSLMERLVYGKVKRSLGLDRCRLPVTGAAPIRQDTLEFFLGLNFPLYEIYGMSECTGPTTVSVPGIYKPGYAGKPIPGTEVQIASDGEVLMRGPHVCMGYLHDTASFPLDEEGWLHSGDLGSLDAEGFLCIEGRKKNLIITAGGENISPEMIESQVSRILGVEHAVVIGDQRKHLCLLITLDVEMARVQAGQRGSKANSRLELARCLILYAYFEAEIQRINAGLARVQTLKRFRILDAGFCESEGELTPTQKIKRSIIERRYKKEIQSLYG